MLPTQNEIELPLLEALERLGGKATPKQVYPLVTASFPGITEDELEARLKHGESVWRNRVQWVRQRLKDSGDLVSPERGVWAISDQGRARLDGRPAPGHVPADRQAAASLLQLQEEHDRQFRSKLLDRLLDLEPIQFEHFARKLLHAYGFASMTVTQASGDGGIDGHGMLRVGLAKMKVAFQCKRWAGNVGRPEVDKFRGAIQGEFQQGLFYTTSDFTKHATDASIRAGAVPIVLLNGPAIVDLMVKKQFGVLRRPLEIFEDDVYGLFGDDADD